jgi:hypothetical protein
VTHLKLLTQTPAYEAAHSKASMRRLLIPMIAVALVKECLSWSYLVNCGTAMTSAGHKKYTAAGGGTPVLKRGGAALSCGNNLNPNEQLSLTSSGTYGNLANYLPEV